MLYFPRSVLISSELSIKNFDIYSFLECKKVEKIILQCNYRILDYSKLPKCVYHIECDKESWSIDPRFYQLLLLIYQYLIQTFVKNLILAHYLAILHI